MAISEDGKEILVNSWWLDQVGGDNSEAVGIKMAHEEWAHYIMGESKNHEWGYWYQAETTCLNTPIAW